jgi:hypothetical protein
MNLNPLFFSSYIGFSVSRIRLHSFGELWRSPMQPNAPENYLVIHFLPCKNDHAPCCGETRGYNRHMPQAEKAIHKLRRHLYVRRHISLGTSRGGTHAEADIYPGETYVAVTGEWDELQPTSIHAYSLRGHLSLDFPSFNPSFTSCCCAGP